MFPEKGEKYKCLKTMGAVEKGALELLNQS